VAELVAAGERVYGVRVLSSTLEDTYLEAVAGGRSEAPQAPAGAVDGAPEAVAGS
jgi:hypothetical protein